MFNFDYITKEDQKKKIQIDQEFLSINIEY